MVGRSVQMTGMRKCFFLKEGFRVVAHDRRGHGRSTQVWDGHDMDHYADDVAVVVEHLGVQGAVHVGHSTGGGEVAHYVARYPNDPVAKAVLISAVPPLMVKTESNPDGLPKEVFDDLQNQLLKIVLNFIMTYLQVHFMDITDQEQKYQNLWC